MTHIVYERAQTWTNPHTLDGQVPACMTWKIPSRYVLHKPWWERLVSWQRGRCALCGYKRPSMVVDHCHISGLIRGRICGACNRLEVTSEGQRFVRWRAGWHAAAMLGIEEEYVSPITGLPVLDEQGWRLRMTDEARAAYDRGQMAALEAAVRGICYQRSDPEQP